jgi:hypothetical protein
MPESRWLKPTDEHLAGVANLARALGRGSTKLCEALSLLYGSRRYGLQGRAEKIDEQIQPLVSELVDIAKPPTKPV